VVEHPGFFLRQDDDPASPVSEPLEHALPPLFCGPDSSMARACPE